MKKHLIQEINRQKEMMGIIKEQGLGVEEPVDIIDELREILAMWEEKSYESDEARWKAYYEDIEKLVEKHDGGEGGWPILQDPGHGGSTPSIEYQLANPDTLERGLDESVVNEQKKEDHIEEFMFNSNKRIEANTEKILQILTKPSKPWNK